MGVLLAEVDQVAAVQLLDEDATQLVGITLEENGLFVNVTCQNVRSCPLSLADPEGEGHLGLWTPKTQSCLFDPPNR